MTDIQLIGESPPRGNGVKYYCHDCKELVGGFYHSCSKNRRWIKELQENRREIWEVISEILYESEIQIEKYDMYGIVDCEIDYVIGNILPKYGIVFIEGE